MRLLLYAESSLLTGNTTNYLNVHNTNKESQAKMTPPHQGHFSSPERVSTEGGKVTER